MRCDKMRNTLFNICYSSQNDICYRGSWHVWKIFCVDVCVSEAESVCAAGPAGAAELCLLFLSIYLSKQWSEKINTTKNLVQMYFMVNWLYLLYGHILMLSRYK